MSRMNFARLVELLEDADFTPRSYSGRAMYGANCLGVTCSNPAQMLVRLFASFVETADPATGLDEVAELAEMLDDPKTDSMGRDAIIYWPDIAWEGGDEQADDE